MDGIYEALSPLIPKHRLVMDAPMRDYTTFCVGGPADLLVDAASPEEIRAVLLACRKTGTKLTVVGNGSNLLVRDGGIRGVVLRIADHMAGIRAEGLDITAQAGATLSALSHAAAQAGLAGAVFCCGIPGTLGGAAVMNAGAYGGEMAQIIRCVDALDGDGQAVRLCLEALDYGYRRSALMARGLIVTQVELRLERGEREALLAQMTELNRRRREKQPLTVPSAGSTFKRPKEGYASQMIDEAGLRGASVGGAQVSEKHTGFLVNTGGATAKDVLALMAHVQDTVEARFGVRLEPEVRIIGEE